MGELADKLRYAMQDGTIRTEILGTAKLILEGCDGVIEYETEKIGLRCGRRGACFGRYGTVYEHCGENGSAPHSTSKGWERRAFHLVCEGLQKAA